MIKFDIRYYDEVSNSIKDERGVVFSKNREGLFSALEKWYDVDAIEEIKFTFSEDDDSPVYVFPEN